jgi:hypothetical protein
MGRAEPWSTSIASSALSIFGLGSATVTPGGTLNIYGTGMTSTLTPAVGTAEATVLFDGKDPVSDEVTSGPSGAQRVTVAVPAGIAVPQTSITVVADGVASQPFTVYVVA